MRTIIILTIAALIFIACEGERAMLPVNTDNLVENQDQTQTPDTTLTDTDTTTTPDADPITVTDDVATDNSNTTDQETVVTPDTTEVPDEETVTVPDEEVVTPEAEQDQPDVDNAPTYLITNCGQMFDCRMKDTYVSQGAPGSENSQERNDWCAAQGKSGSYTRSQMLLVAISSCIAQDIVFTFETACESSKKSTCIIKEWEKQLMSYDSLKYCTDTMDPALIKWGC